ncbi:hypothetical protein EDB85DRAFT_1890875 [Lactarius pseudohatsudake]|nr:hypothetical protein EDB85DRAFT_1890875 [Lactarius pseudohatsudake]
MSSNEQDESVQWTSGDSQNATGTTAPQQSENANQANGNPNVSQGNNHNNTFLHPGARAIFEGTVSGDGPYECRNRPEQASCSPQSRIPSRPSAEEQTALSLKTHHALKQDDIVLMCCAQSYSAASMERVAPTLYSTRVFHRYEGCGEYANSSPVPGVMTDRTNRTNRLRDTASIRRSVASARWNIAQTTRAALGSGRREAALPIVQVFAGLVTLYRGVGCSGTLGRGYRAREALESRRKALRLTRVKEIDTGDIEQRNRSKVRMESREQPTSLGCKARGLAGGKVKGKGPNRPKRGKVRSAKLLCAGHINILRGMGIFVSVESVQVFYFCEMTGARLWWSLSPSLRMRGVLVVPWVQSTVTAEMSDFVTSVTDDFPWVASSPPPHEWPTQKLCANELKLLYPLESQAFVAVFACLFVTLGNPISVGDHLFGKWYVHPAQSLVSQSLEGAPATPFRD